MDRILRGQIMQCYSVALHKRILGSLEHAGLWVMEHMATFDGQPLARIKEE